MVSQGEAVVDGFFFRVLSPPSPFFGSFFFFAFPEGIKSSAGRLFRESALFLRGKLILFPTVFFFELSSPGGVQMSILLIFR